MAAAGRLCSTHPAPASSTRQAAGGWGWAVALTRLLRTSLPCAIAKLKWPGINSFAASARCCTPSVHHATAHWHLLPLPLPAQQDQYLELSSWVAPSTLLFGAGEHASHTLRLE